MKTLKLLSVLTLFILIGCVEEVNERGGKQINAEQLPNHQ